jgi:endo-1,4-beta-D-glucanase Y
MAACASPPVDVIPGPDDGGTTSDGSARGDGRSQSSPDGGGSPLSDGSTSPDASQPLMRGPTAATATVNFPFPQNRQASGCVYPTAYQNPDVLAAYAKWKADLVTPSTTGGPQRVQRTATDGVDACRPLNSTVSEGIGYGMLIAVYMGDQGLFDDLWLYEQQNLDGNGLMNWAPNGSGPSCQGAATDADEDMAFALVMADKQWGGQGTLSQSYTQAAITQIQNVWDHEVYNYSWLSAGDAQPGQQPWATNANQNISYFAPSYYRVFAQVDLKTCPQGSDVAYATAKSCDRWWGVIDQSYTTIGDALNTANGNQSNGLVPGWCDDSHGAPCTAAAGQPFNYQYDACRTPFRIGLDSCWNGYAAAQSYVASTSAFFAGIGASHIVDGYALNGMPQAANPGKLSAAFLGPASVGAMSSTSHQQFVDDGYALIAMDSAFAGGEYYESSWTVMSLLMLTGNFLDYTQETPAH